MNSGLTGSTFLITGASGGIGAATARALAEDGANLVLHCFRNLEGVSELAAGLRRHRIVIDDVSGMVFKPLAGAWSLSDRDLDVNYLLAGHRA